ncbi:MAG: DUF1015 domain-containing protein [Acidobacteriia bacterium]|nr:DUF1015 domain-containing protein [Terriglobia bacterium]
MATIFPFRALRYNPGRVDVQRVVTQPYDKITPAMQQRYYAASPYNLVRIILGKREPADDEKSNVYTRAADDFRRWRSEGVLRPDAAASLYAYSQEFRAPGTEKMGTRRGFIGLGQIEPYEAGVVFRHEQTLSAPKQDRLNLLRATRAHFGQIFMLYSDPGREVETQLFRDAKPTIEVTDEYGVVHRIWAVPEVERVEAATRAMADKKLIIADGHHRYETALRYRDERRAGGGKADGNQAYDRVMMTFVNVDAPGLVILPTHRVVHGLEDFQAGEMVRVARNFFAVEDITSRFDPERPTAALAAGGEGTALLAVTKGNKFLMRAPAGARHASMEGLSSRQAELDVVRLHRVVLGSVLGMSEESIREQKHIEYVRDAKEAVARVQGGANVAFLMNPARIEQVRDIAFAGEVLPQKSTDFYPKMLSGLTIYALE